MPQSFARVASSTGTNLVVVKSACSGAVATLPNLSFRGDLLYIVSAEECADACSRLEQSLQSSREDMGGRLVLGFDIEWRASYERGVGQPRTATIQLATVDVAVIFHLSRCGCVHPPLAHLLGRVDVLKVGVGSIGDAHKLRRDYGGGESLPEQRLLVRSVHELNDLARQSVGSADRNGKPVSLSTLCEELLGHCLPKPQVVRCGNWEAIPLSQMQLDYAAADAWAGLRCFRELQARAPVALTEAINTLVEPIDSGVRKRQAFVDGGVGEIVDAASELAPLPSGTRQVHRLFHEKKLTIDSIAMLRGVQASTVLSDLIDAVEAGYAYNLADFGVSSADQASIIAALVDSDHTETRLKTVHDMLPGHIEYWAIKLMRAHKARSELGGTALKAAKAASRGDEKQERVVA
eukprot:TRINITY_DN61580_c0_g1_i1.p1 TRINITY_DN61580_c0_g1~~TRINITY_DN61580_c0_g1_i1.p1  ORF type:complete len:453 (-),score=56.68 TRINITY_DN61580_c0_g1_i1:149-1369(-)